MIQQRTNQLEGFQAADRHEPEGEQPLGKEGTDNPIARNREAVAALFSNRKGNVIKPLRLALGACIIQAEYGYSDEETAM